MRCHRTPERAALEARAADNTQTGTDASMIDAQHGGLSNAILLRAALATTAAAVLGGLVWGGIVAATGTEIGFVAWGIGLLTGGAAILLSKGERGLPLQLMAVVSSILGIAIGKYISFYVALKGVVAEESGAEAAESLSPFSSEVFSFFQEVSSEIFSPFDLVWVGLAVFTAWRIPKIADTSASTAA